ncbi:SRPBCC family protein [Chryseolinea lacunae]|uniref:SRPBCC family protein n=1 Tax=Chryseolinea lacunae TaxID=2801331 RepID=A0ABS1KKF4_9BACT|nr:SRPBCC family protein [Chryseolinea lacunae]MBL0739712.1 SRPBCC family protein [Chryseolinea lacunae]
MKIYSLKRVQVLPLALPDAWRFFADPKNLQKITPPHMGFSILYQSGFGAMYAGQLVRYRIHVFPFVPMQWLTEITHVNEPHYFVDEQRFGPYAFWHHQHHLKAVPGGGVEVTDEVNYAIPLGWLGRFANALFVERQLNAIFDYRYKVLEEFFNTAKMSVQKPVSA